MLSSFGAVSLPGFPPGLGKIWVLLIAIIILALGCSSSDKPDNPADGDADLDAEISEIAESDGDQEYAEEDAESEEASEAESDGDSDHELESDWPETLGCNGDPILCDRRFNEVAMVVTHNAFSSEEDGFIGPNQHFGLSRQLADGIRGFLLDTHYGSGEFEGVPMLCHGDCVFGQMTLADGLTIFRDFLAERPNNVVMLFFEDYVSPEDTAAVFADVGLDSQAYSHTLGEPWPTLNELIAAQTRLVVFTQGSSGGIPWYHEGYSEIWDTPYSNTDPESLRCTVGRGSLSNPVFQINHFLTNPIASARLAEKINPNPFFIDWVLACAREKERMPNFIVVDFYDVGDVFDVVAEINRLAPEWIGPPEIQ